MAFSARAAPLPCARWLRVPHGGASRVPQAAAAATARRRLLLPAARASALVAILGRVEVQRSLRTADHREALLRAAVVEAGLARRWRSLLAMREDVMHSLGQHEVERLAEEYFERLVAEDPAGWHAWRPIGQVP
ncbi:MAG: DUF6538 domain-containing protein [Myxococcota bacterium]